jgi:MYXO-CTERM domain-containing protein
MKHTHRFLVAATFALAFAAPSLSHADVPPPDACQTPGQSCDTAPPDYQSPGTCVATNCPKAGPDGGFDVPCNLCVPDDGGTGTGGAAGSGSGGAAGSSAGGSAGKSSGSSSDDGGCSLSGAPAQGGAALGMLLLGLGAMALGRRRAR